MSSNPQRELLKKLYRNLEDKPLEPDNIFYYPILKGTEHDPVENLAERISFSQSQSVNLFTGQSGSGKSTEFRRLRQTLIEDDCEVFLLDMEFYMSLTTPIEISDFLISMMIALSEAVNERFNKNPQHIGYLERLGNFLTRDIQIPEIDIGGIKASLKEDPGFKEKLQNALRGHVAPIVKDAHDFAKDVVTLIRRETGDENKKIVLLVDSVEKLRGVGAEGSQAVYNSAVNLFSGFASSLQIPMLHIVYTIPPYITPLVPGLGRQLGCNLGCTLPSIHVQTKQNQVDGEGLKIMCELLKMRCPQDWQTIFGDETEDFGTHRQNKKLITFAKASGGDFRDFFRLIRDSLTKAKGVCPIPDSVIEDTLNHARREMLPIAQHDKDWLIKINDSKDAELGVIEDLPMLARFFDSKLVLNYRNGDDWYDVHPLLRDEIRK